MKIIISPAKKMRTADTIGHRGLPVFLSESEKLKIRIQELSYEEAKKLWECNDKIARENFERFGHMDLKKRLTPAILSYDGIQYTYMAPSVFTDREFEYIERNIRILSGFYGVLKPMDGVTPYRLEMQAKLSVEGCRDLYDFWGDRLYREVRDESCTMIDLASKEYSKCIEAYITPKDRFITCVFGEIESGRIVQKGVYAKMARGEMVRYMAENEIKEPEEVRSFNRGGYSFREDLSTENKYVFIREKTGMEQ